MQEPMLKVAPTQCATLESLHLCTSMLWIYANDEWIAAVGCTLHGWPFCGTFPSFIFRTSLTQHFLVVAAYVLLQRSEYRQCGHSWAAVSDEIFVTSLAIERDTFRPVGLTNLPYPDP